MSTLYFNYITIKANKIAELNHEKIISELVNDNTTNSHRIDDFKFENLIKNFLPYPLSNLDSVSYPEIDCKWAYIDERLKKGDCLTIISADGVPYVLQDLYLEKISCFDEHAIVKMYTTTYQPNEEWLRNVKYMGGKGDNIIQLPGGMKR